MLGVYVHNKRFIVFVERGLDASVFQCRGCHNQARFI